MERLEQMVLTPETGVLVAEAEAVVVLEAQEAVEALAEVGDHLAVPAAGEALEQIRAVW
jgi:tetrahydromethanopterin S-methyltransferase subunit B